MSNILVTGATGPLGHGVISNLLSRTSAKNIYALARTEEKAAPLKKAGVNVRFGDYDDFDSLEKAFQGIDKLYMVSNTDVEKRFTQHDNVVAAALEAGVGYIAYTSYMRKTESEDSPIRAVAAGHLNTEAKLKASGIPYTILKHGMYADMIPFFAGNDVLTNKLIYFPAGDGRASMVLRADQAEAGAIILLDETGKYHDQSLELTGPEALSWVDVADLIGSVTGVTIQYQSPSEEEYTRTVIGAGFPEGYAHLFANFGKTMKANEFATVSPTLVEVLGRAVTPIKSFLQELYGKTSALMAFLLVAFTFLLSSPIFGQGSKDEQAVKNVVASFQDDFNDGRYLKVDSYTTLDWVHINPIGGITYGRDSVLKEVLPLQPTILKGAAMTTESMTVRFLSPTVAVALVVHQVGDYEFPQGVKHHNERYMKTYILVKRQNKWLLTLDQNDVIVPQ